MQSQQPGFRSNLPARVCRVRGSTGVNCPMRYLSEWNAFNPYDRETYPKVNAPVQVTYEGGRVGEGFSLDFFPAFGATFRFTHHTLALYQTGGPPVDCWRELFHRWLCSLTARTLLGHRKPN